MAASDEFSQYYREHLDDTYDCPDRIVLNAYFRLGQSPGGFRTWWRNLHGTDENLDTTHLMRYAGRFARRIRAYAQKKKIPVIECKRGDRKKDMVEPLVPQDPRFRGIFCIVVGRAPAPVWDVKICSNGQPHLERKTPRPYVNHYSFHILDDQWGHVIIKLCPHPPFNAMIIVNGHEYVARQARRRKISFTKEGNCFTHASNAAGLASLAETMSAFGAVGQLAAVCERWIYSSCLVFALDRSEQERTHFRYAYSTYPCEYSRNLLFRSGAILEPVFPSVIDRTRGPLHMQSLKTIFGYKHRPSKRGGQPPRFEVVVERPPYDLTVFKVHFGTLTATIYSKGERVLRIEVIVHNARELRCRRGLEYFPEIVATLKTILERFLSVLQAVNVSCLDEPTWESWPLPSTVGRTRVGGIQLHHPRLRAVLEAVVALAIEPRGFTSAQLAETVRRLPYGKSCGTTKRQASDDLKKLRGHGLLVPVGHSRRYQAPPEKVRAVAGFFVLREKVLRPLLANAGRRPTHRPSRMQSPADAHYITLQGQMQKLFECLGVAA